MNLSCNTPLDDKYGFIYSDEWFFKNRLFDEAFPDASARVEFISDFASKIIKEYMEQEKSPEDLNDLIIRKMAIDWWFSLIPKSLLRNIHQ